MRTLIVVCLFGLMLPAGPAFALSAIMRTTEGEVTIRLFPDKAPQAVENFVGLATGSKGWTDPHNGKTTLHKPLYNGTIFQRIVPQFMIQGGDAGGYIGIRFNDEFHPSLRFDHAGIVAMANSGPNSNSCQFFITVAPTPVLNNRYTIFGEVTKGMDVVNRIVSAERVPGSERPVRPTTIKSIEILRND